MPFAFHNSQFIIAFDARMVHYRRAGIGQYAISLLHAFARMPEMGRGSRVYMLQMRADRAPIVRDERFRRVPMMTPPHNRFEQLGLGVELLKLRPAPQLIHCPDFIPPWYRRFPAVINIQDLAFLKFPETGLLTGESERYYGQVYRAARNAEAIIALSASARDDIVSLLGVPSEKVAVIPAAASDQFAPPSDLRQVQEQVAREFGLPGPDEGGYILFVGTIEPRKNLPVLLEAYRAMLDRGKVTPAPVLTIAGKEGWLVETVYSKIGELHLGEQIRRLDEVPAPGLVRLYQGARVFALPSLYEGFGLPALEALGCGTPVLASSGGSLPEVVGHAGILLDPHDPGAWCAALEQVLLDPREESRLRAAGPVQASHFSWDRAALQTWELYGRVTSRR